MPAMKFSRSAALNQSANINFTNCGTPAARAPPVSVVGMINSDTSPMSVHSCAVRSGACDFAASTGTESDRPNVVASCTKARRSSDGLSGVNDSGSRFITNLSSLLLARTTQRFPELLVVGRSLRGRVVVLREPPQPHTHDL